MSEILWSQLWSLGDLISADLASNISVHVVVERWVCLIDASKLWVVRIVKQPAEGELAFRRHVDGHAPA